MNFIKRLRLKTVRPHQVHYGLYGDICTASVIPMYGARVAVWVPLITSHRRQQVVLYSLRTFIEDLKNRYPEGSVVLCFDEPLANDCFNRAWKYRSSFLLGCIGRAPVQIATRNMDFLTAPPFEFVTVRLDALADVSKIDVTAIKEYGGRVDFVGSDNVYRAISDLHKI